MPILQNVLISAGSGAITLSATNLEIGITCTLRGKIEEEGSVTLEARKINEYIGLLPKQVVSFESGDDMMARVSCENYVTKIRGASPEDFPLIPTIESETPIICREVELKRALSNTVFATMQNESRPELSGVFMKMVPEKGELCVVATDAYRLAEHTIKAESMAPEAHSVIVPLKTMQEVLRMLGDDPQGTVKISINENQILFATEAVTIISKVVLGEYPDYKLIIPPNWMTKVTLDTGELIKAIKASSIFSTKGLNDVVIDCITEDGKSVVKVSSSNATVGENTVTLETPHYQGDNNHVVLNHRYILEGLMHLDGDKVELAIVDSETACVLKSGKDSPYLYLVMPIKQ